MDTRMIGKLKEKLCEELENVSRKPQFTATDLESIHKLIVSIEKLMKIEQMDGGYSQQSYGGYSRDSYADRSYRDGSYGGESYARYSRDDGAHMVKNHIRKMMDENGVSSNDRRILEKAMEILG